MDIWPLILSFLLFSVGNFHTTIPAFAADADSADVEFTSNASVPASEYQHPLTPSQGSLWGPSYS